MDLEAIERTAVLGLGTMGHGIAQAFATGGYRVRGYDAQKATCASLHQRIEQNLLDQAEAGLLDRPAIPAILSRITVVDTEEQAVGEAQVVTEAVAEDLPTKQDLWARVENLVGADAILASNSSTFPISQSGARLRRPERALVTHWFNPPHIVPVVEVVPGPSTSTETTDTTVALLRKIGKRPIHLRKETPGFLVNRVQMALTREIWNLLDQQVASAEDIDAAVRGTLGFRLAAIGQLEVADFSGLDVQTAVFRNLAPELRTNVEPPPVVNELVAAGHYGAKTGRGFYEYPPAVLRARQARRDRLFFALFKLLYSSDDV